MKRREFLTTASAAALALTLDGTGSSDPDNDVLTYSWTLTTPAGSHATLEGANTATPEFTPDVRGHYTATLTVTDPSGESSSASVTIEGETLLEAIILDLLGQHC